MCQEEVAPRAALSARLRKPVFRGRADLVGLTLVASVSSARLDQLELLFN